MGRQSLQRKRQIRLGKSKEVNAGAAASTEAAFVLNQLAPRLDNGTSDILGDSAFTARQDALALYRGDLLAAF